MYIWGNQKNLGIRHNVQCLWFPQSHGKWINSIHTNRIHWVPIEEFRIEFLDCNSNYLLISIEFVDQFPTQEFEGSFAETQESIVEIQENQSRHTTQFKGELCTFCVWVNLCVFVGVRWNLCVQSSTVCMYTHIYIYVCKYTYIDRYIYVSMQSSIHGKKWIYR